MKNKLSIAQFQNFKEIGHGAFGKVYQATFKTTGKIVALKKISKKQIKNNNMMTQISNEIQISKKLQHPNIVKLYDYFDDQNDIYLVLELASGGQLYNKLMKSGRLDQAQTKRMIKQIISAVKYLHENKIIHRDIKPENILMDKKGNVKLADFGWSNFSGGDKPRKTYCGTVDYLAPEMIDKSGHDQSLDIWCLGVLVFQLLTGRTPFVSQNIKGPQKKKMIEQNILNMNINFPNDFPTLAKGFVLGMIKRNPKQRFKLEQIQTHEWLLEKIEQKTEQLQPVLMNKKPPKQYITIENTSSESQIIEKLMKKNKELQEEISLLKVNSQMKQQFKTDQNDMEISLMKKDLRRLRPLQQKLITLQKDYEQLWESINKKEKQIIVLKSQQKRVDDIKQQCSRLILQKKKLEEKSRKLEKENTQLKNKEKQLSEQLNLLSANVSTKIKTGKQLTFSDITTPQFREYLEQQLENLGLKYEECKKLFVKVLERQKMNKQKQDQLGRLKAQEKQLKDILKLQLKQQFENQKDMIILNARKQLMNERERWIKQRQQLKQIFQSAQTSQNGTTSNYNNKQEDLELELQTIKQLNIYYEKSIGELSFRIKDLEGELKRKK